MVQSPDFDPRRVLDLASKVSVAPVLGSNEIGNCIFAFGILLLAPGAVARCEERLRRFRVDLSPDNQRRDVLAPDSYEWRIGEAGPKIAK